MSIKKLKIQLVFLVLLASFLYIVKFNQAINFVEKNEKLIFTGIDSYYYARLANLIAYGKYTPGETDFLTFVPDSWRTGFPKFPEFPPLISILTAYIIKSLNLSAEEVAFFVYPLLSILFVIPLFFLLKDIYNNLLLFSFLTIFIVSTPIYMLRTAPGWLDNDHLNLFFPLILLFILVKTLNTEGVCASTLVMFLFLITISIYYLWYPKPPLQILFWGIYVYLLIRKREYYSKILGLINILMAISFIIFNFNKIEYLFRYYLFERAAIYGQFPNIYVTISELNKLNIDGLNLYIGLSAFGIIWGFIGFILLLKEFKRKYGSNVIVAFLPIFLISLLPFFLGVKFLLYTSVIIGIGISYLTLYVLRRVDKKFYLKIFLKVLLVIAIVEHSYKALTFSPNPSIPPMTVEDIKRLKELTSYNAWVLTWWDYGEAIKYYAHRATYHDPFNQNFPKTYLIAYLLSNQLTQDKLKNFINALSYYTNFDIVNWISEGRDIDYILSKFLNFNGEPINESIYIFFTADMLYKYGQIYFIGKWKENKLGKFYFKVFGFCAITLSYGVKCPEGLIINPYTNKFYYNGEEIAVDKIIYKKLNGSIVSFDIQKKAEKSNVIAEVVETKYGLMVILLNKEVYETIFNKMFILRYFNTRSFELIYDNFPFGVLYKLNPKIY